MNALRLRKAVDEFLLVSSGLKPARGNTHLVELCWAAVSAVAMADHINQTKLLRRAERRAKMEVKA